MSKKKLKAGWFYCDIYKENFYTHIGWSEKKYREYSKKNYGWESDFYGEGQTLTLNKGYVIWVNKKTNYPVIAHECVHVAAAVLTKKGIDIKEGDNEALAYLVEYIYKKVLAV